MQISIQNRTTKSNDGNNHLLTLNLSNHISRTIVYLKLYFVGHQSCLQLSSHNETYIIVLFYNVFPLKYLTFFTLSPN